MALTNEYTNSKRFSIFGKISRFFQKKQPTSPEKIVSESVVFKSLVLADTLKKDGVVKISFLDNIALESIQSLYRTAHPTGHPTSFFDGIHMTIWDENDQYKTSIRKQLEEILKPFFDAHFMNYRALSQQFIVKLPGKETTFPVHQDWSIVNERDYFSLNIWIPLQDVDSTNGAMWIVKGSHRLQQPIRGAGSLFPNYFPLLEEMKPYMTSFPMKAGEALIFYHSTIHGSPQNLSDQPRLTVQVSVLPQEAPMEIYFQPIGSTAIEVHHPDDNFNFHYANIREESVTKAPTASCSRIITDYKLKKVSIESIKNIQNLN
jgi:hypothetical protein